jgi:hypothetical protein
MPEVKPSFIYGIFDSVVASTPLFSLPRYEAFLHSFRLLEALESNFSVQGRGLDDMLLAERKYQDAKQYLIHLIYAKCPSGGRYILTNKSHIKATLAAIEIAYSYSQVHSMIVGAEKGWGAFYFNEIKKELSFNYHDPVKSTQFFNKFNDRVAWESKNLKTLAADYQELERFNLAITQLVDTVRITREKELRFTTNPFIHSAIEEYLNVQLSKQYTLNDSWSLGPYQISDFRSVWIQLCKLCLFRLFAFLESVKKYGDYDPGYNNILCRKSKTELTQFISKYTKLKERVISEILIDLIYDPSIRFIDIIQQPLVEMNKNDICFSPSLVLGSHIDRNLQVLLNKLPHRQKAYDVLKTFKEDLYRPKVILKEDHRVISEIDLLIWDKNTEGMLIAQLKWFYGADSVQEVFNHDVQYSDGIQKTKISIEYLKRNYYSLAARLNLRTYKNPEIYGIIVSRTGTPSPYIDDPSFPVIEEEDFIGLISKQSGNVDRLFYDINSHLVSRKEFPPVSESSIELKVGDYQFILPALSF